MSDKKVSELSAITNLSQDDLLLVVDDPAGTPSSKKVTVGNLFGNVAVETSFKKNATFSGNTTTFGSNVVASGTMTVDGVNVKSGINDRIQMANVAATYATNTYVQGFASGYATNTDFQSYVSNTNSRVSTIEATIAGYSNTFITDTLIVPVKYSDPATSNAVTESKTAGTIFYSNTYLYITTNSNTIKRIALSTF